MSKIILLVDRINKYLRQRNLEKIQGDPRDLLSLYELALRSVWKIEDPETRDNYAVDIGTLLTPYFGGHNVAEALKTLKVKLKKDIAEEKVEASKQTIKDKMSDPDYVPTFEELMKVRDEES